MPATSEPAKVAPAIIALTGFMGAGKSTVGHALASLLKWRFIDLDAEIESRHGRSIPEIFAADGEVRFRQLEADELRSVLAQANAPTVIALGGGTFVHPDNAELLRQQRVHVVFLELALEHLLQRCREAREHSRQNPRPLAEDEEAFRRLYAERLPSYRKAHVVLDAEDKSPEQIAREIAAALRLREQSGSSS